MNELASILLVSWGAGITAFLGGMIAQCEGSADSIGKREFIHGMVAFGGGILVAAVAFALAPEGMRVLSIPGMALAFCGGGIFFCLIDAWLTRTEGSVAQFMAMLLDFIPEAVSLGAVFAHDRRLGLLLALFIGLQNLPEGFNSFREIVHTGASRIAALATLLGASLFGPLAATCGYFFLRQQDTAIAGIMTFAAGGILYLIFQDIGKQAAMRRHWTPPLGSILGFLVGMIGKKMLG